MSNVGDTHQGLSAFTSPGRFWRGNLHTHTTASDGNHTTDEIVGAYRGAGYDFLSITDHFRAQFGYPLTDASGYDGPGFITIRGAELHAGWTRAGELWHMLAVGLPEGFAAPHQGEEVASLVDRALDGGAFVAAAHPALQGVTPEEILKVGPIHAVETWNANGAYYDRSDSWYVLDQLLSRGSRCFALATDDAHSLEDRYWRRGWVQVKAQDLTPTAIVAALKSGSYYSSTGPSIEDIRLDVAGRQLTVTCSPVERIAVTSIGMQFVGVEGTALTQGVLDLDSLHPGGNVGPFVRVTLCDHEGGRAWSNPIWIAGTTSGRTTESRGVSGYGSQAGVEPTRLHP